ncbi:MAG: twin-arginine translocase subunit TatC [Chloroflexi bacterium]|nr:MAG: twin-arginine translocase subunit TatC [Chloroflexota bacterium]TMD82981.1 MAG: twin-arginine translocase subunit TatC [Chloroflexota bacterium]
MAKPHLVRPDDERRMTVMEHLEELRRVLIISLIAWAVATVLAFLVSGWILQLLLVPIKQVIHNQPLYFTRPVEKFLLYFKIGLVGGLILAAPVIFWQVWGFVAPGLRRNERRFAVGFVASACLLFILGIFFAFFALPIALRFLIGFGTSDIKYLPLATSYINFALLLIAIFGITFELPLAMTMLGLVGIVTPAFLNRNRFKFWLGIFVGANFVTPGADPFTPLLLTVPLILLFEASIQVIRALRR